MIVSPPYDSFRLHVPFPLYYAIHYALYTIRYTRDTILYYTILSGLRRRLHVPLQPQTGAPGTRPKVLSSIITICISLHILYIYIYILLYSIIITLRRGRARPPEPALWPPREATGLPACLPTSYVRMHYVYIYIYIYTHTPKYKQCLNFSILARPRKSLMASSGGNRPDHSRVIS